MDAFADIGNRLHMAFTGDYAGAGRISSGIVCSTYMRTA